MSIAMLWPAHALIYLGIKNYIIMQKMEALMPTKPIVRSGLMEKSFKQKPLNLILFIKLHISQENLRLVLPFLPIMNVIFLRKI